MQRKPNSRHQRRRPRPTNPSLVLFNKPFGVLTQFSGQPDDRTLAEFIDKPNVYPAGRLDKDSEGLLLLTDDGRLQAQVADPRYKAAKVYYVLVEGQPEEQQLQQLRDGVELKDGMTRPAEVTRVTEPDWLWPRTPPVRVRKTIVDTWLQLTIREGRNRQVRRMTAHIGHPTLRLIRYQIGDWTLANLAPGEWREVSPPQAVGVARRQKK